MVRDMLLSLRSPDYGHVECLAIDIDLTLESKNQEEA